MILRVELNIRKALNSDAEACSLVLCDSIRELCVLDHCGNERTIERWIANKTPENLKSWIGQTGMTIYLAETPDFIAAVGGIDDASGITLNYVAPNARFLGVSRQLLKTLENQLRSKGVERAKLTSTETAHRFYQTAGWRDVAEPEIWLGMKGYPMVKTLPLV